MAVNSAMAEAPPAPAITTKSAVVKPVAAPGKVESAQALHDAAAGFIQRVNYARVALAMENIQLAKQHITEAQRFLSAIRASNPEQLRMTRVGAGRVTYKDNEGKFYYPVETGPIMLEKTRQGPALNKEGLAVTDAEIAYVMLDFRDNEADKLLAKALQNIDSNDLKDAQGNLGDLMSKVIDTNNTEVSVPLDQARDNIALARSFIVMENYDGARFALKHADKALDEMEKDKRYEARRAAVTALRQEVSTLDKTVQKNDPSFWQKADIKLKELWEKMRNWTNN